ncbi:MAG: hypothetical protein WKF43_11835 [Acidimicrobiales bacterium]
MPGPSPTLSDIVDLLDEALDARHPDHSTVVRVRRLVADIEIGLRPLDPGVHPVDALLGFRAPLDWDAIGVISPGQAYDAVAVRPPVPVRLLHLVERSGATRSRWRSLDGSEHPAAGEAGGGFVHDCCRRVLGLPTAPPPCDPVAWWSALWLERVLATALAEPARQWCWPDLARLHPLFAKGAVPGRPEALAARVRAQARSTGWPALRAKASGGRAGGSLPAAIWRWMDDGLFARWALAGVPDSHQLLHELGALLRPEHIDALAVAARAGDLR